MGNHEQPRATKGNQWRPGATLGEQWQPLLGRRFYAPGEPPGETFPQLVSFFRTLGVAREKAAFERLGATWC